MEEPNGSTIIAETTETDVLDGANNLLDDEKASNSETVEMTETVEGDVIVDGSDQGMTETKKTDVSEDGDHLVDDETTSETIHHPFGASEGESSAKEKIESSPDNTSEAGAHSSGETFIESYEFDTTESNTYTPTAHLQQQVENNDNDEDETAQRLKDVSEDDQTDTDTEEDGEDSPHYPDNYEWITDLCKGYEEVYDEKFNNIKKNLSTTMETIRDCKVKLEESNDRMNDMLERLRRNNSMLKESSEGKSQDPSGDIQK